MAKIGQSPPLLGRRLGGRVSVGLLGSAAVAVVLAVGFNLTAIASIGSAVALIVFTLVTSGHLRIRSETGARIAVLLTAVFTTVVVLLTFASTTLVHEPATAVALVIILLMSIGLNIGWKMAREHDPSRGKQTGQAGG